MSYATILSGEWKIVLSFESVQGRTTTTREFCTQLAKSIFSRTTNVCYIFEGTDMIVKMVDRVLGCSTLLNLSLFLKKRLDNKTNVTVNYLLFILYKKIIPLVNLVSQIFFFSEHETWFKNWWYHHSSIIWKLCESKQFLIELSWMCFSKYSSYEVLEKSTKTWSK